MTDIDKIRGPNNPSEPSGPKKKDKLEGKDFEEFLKIKETDPEEKRKRREKAEEEEKIKEDAEIAAAGAPAPTPSEKVTPFSVEKHERAGPVESKKAPSGTTSSQQRGMAPRTEPSEAEKVEEKKAEVFKEQTPIQEKEAFVKGLEAEKKEKAELPKQEEEVAPQALPSQVPTVKETAKKEEKEEKIIPLSAPAPTVTGPTMPAVELPPPSPANYVRLPSQVLELYERMVGVMTIMVDSGIKETTIHLTADQFASSPFYGSQIIIKEYATAPKEFNIQFNTTAQAAPIFQHHITDLMAAFQQGNYNFKVRQVEVNIREELVKRKESAGGDTQDQGRQK